MAEGKIDVISQCIGEFGKWQLKHTFLLSLFTLPSAWHIVALIFQAPSVDFWCSPPASLSSMSISDWKNISHVPIKGGETGLYDACRIWDVDYENYTLDTIKGQNFGGKGAGIRSCTEWMYDEDSPNKTITSQWDLVCDRAYLIKTANVAYLSGVPFGGVMSGYFSDRYGRKKTLFSFNIFLLLVALLMAGIPWIGLYLALRFLLGLMAVSILYVAFVLSIELVDGKWRTISGVSYLLPTPVGYIISAGLSYFVRDWKYNQIAISLPTILLLSLYWVVPESPRWLLAKGKVEENMKLLREAAKANKRRVPSIQATILREAVAIRATSNDGVRDILRHSNIRKKTIVSLVIWFAINFIYYGLTINMNFIGDDIFFNTVISGLAEIPSYVISTVILLKMGRKLPMALSLLGCGIFCACNAFIGHGTVYVPLTMAARFFIGCSNAMLPVYTAELFPTTVRNLGVGLSNSSGGIAMVIVPFLFDWSSIANWLPMGVLSACAFIGGLTTLVLPETSQQPMMNTMEENEKYSNQKKDVTETEEMSSIYGIAGTFTETDE